MPMDRSTAGPREMAPEAKSAATPARRGSLLPLTLISAGLWALIGAGIALFFA